MYICVVPTHPHNILTRLHTKCTHAHTHPREEAVRRSALSQCAVNGDALLVEASAYADAAREKFGQARIKGLAESGSAVEGQEGVVLNVADKVCVCVWYG